MAGKRDCRCLLCLFIVAVNLVQLNFPPYYNKSTNIWQFYHWETIQPQSVFLYLDCGSFKSLVVLHMFPSQLLIGGISSEAAIHGPLPKHKIWAQNGPENGLLWLFCRYISPFKSNDWLAASIPQWLSHINLHAVYERTLVPFMWLHMHTWFVLQFFLAFMLY